MLIRIQMHCFIDHNTIFICPKGALLNNLEKGQEFKPPKPPLLHVPADVISLL